MLKYGFFKGRAMDTRTAKTKKYLQKVSPFSNVRLDVSHTMLTKLLEDAAPQPQNSCRQFQPDPNEQKKDSLRRKLLTELKPCAEYHAFGAARMSRQSYNAMQAQVLKWHGSSMEEVYNPAYAATVFRCVLNEFDQYPDVQLLQAEDDLTCMISATLSWYPESVSEMPNLRDKLTLMQKPWEYMERVPAELVFVFSADEAVKTKRLNEILESGIDPEIAPYVPFLTQKEIESICRRFLHLQQLFSSNKTFLANLNINLAFILVNFIPYVDDVQKKLIFIQIIELISKNPKAGYSTSSCSAFSNMTTAMVNIAPCVDTQQRIELIACLEWLKPAKFDLRSFFAVCTLKNSGVFQPEELKSLEVEFAGDAVVYTLDQFIQELQANFRNQDFLTPNTMRHLNQLLHDNRMTQQQADNLIDCILKQIIGSDQDFKQKALVHFLIKHSFHKANPDRQKAVYDALHDRFKIRDYDNLLLDLANTSQKQFLLLRRLLTEQVSLKVFSMFIHKIYAQENSQEAVAVMTDTLQTVLPRGVLGIAASYI
jgi:hypothetical protein